jgi:hypothetical protein
VREQDGNDSESRLSKLKSERRGKSNGVVEGEVDKNLCGDEGNNN